MRNKLINMVILGLVALGYATTIQAQQGQTRSPRATTRQIQTLLIRIETKAEIFKDEVDRALDRSRLNNTNTEDSISDYITDFRNAMDALTQSFEARQSVDNEITEVLNRARFIDRFMTANRLTNAAAVQWRNLKADLNTLAGYYRISWNWNQQLPVNPSYPPYSVSDAQLRSLLTRIETKTDAYKRQLNTALDRSRIDDTTTEDSILSYVTEFENSTDRLRHKFDDRESVSSDVSDVLTRAVYIDRFMTGNRLSFSAQSQWRSLKTDLNTLAAFYRVSWNWNQPLPTVPGGNLPGGSLDNRLTGTYRLNVSESDNVGAVIDKSLRSYTIAQRANVKRNLERRLGSPEMIAIEKNGRSITLASSLQPQVTFDADGTTKTETNNRGRTITTTVTSNRDGLTINYVGDRTNDFYVNFLPTSNGQLKVTRRIYLENRNDQITVSSVYDKIGNTAQWSTVNDGQIESGNLPASSNFIISNGTRLTATLSNAVTTGDSQANDRFTMEVTSPDQYSGSIIEGRVVKAENSGRVSGRATVSLDFETIRLTNGQTYRFAGIIDAVSAANGDNITVNNEGTIRDSNRTTTTATRAGIGAVLGAIIGAVVGGGQGAAIGAGVGAGAGAGTVLIQGRDEIDLGQGSTFTITATAPSNVGVNRQ